MYCVFGCLLTEEGKKIKSEMTSWLKNEFDIIYVDQEPPGLLFEYPAVKKAIDVSIENKEPVLYIHTKGAVNKSISRNANCLKDCIKKPEGVNEYDWQPTIRNLWKHEFTGKRLNDYLKVINQDKPLVVCPFTGEGKMTWYNGFIMNYQASLILLQKIEKSSDRFYYERMFKDIEEIEVIGLLSNNCNLNGPIRKELYEKTWEFYNRQEIYLVNSVVEVCQKRINKEDMIQNIGNKNNKKQGFNNNVISKSSKYHISRRHSFIKKKLY